MLYAPTIAKHGYIDCFVQDCTILTTDTLEILQPCTNPSLCGIYSKLQYTCVAIYSPSVTLPSCLLIHWIWAAITPRTIEVYQNKWDAIWAYRHSNALGPGWCFTIFGELLCWVFVTVDFRRCRHMVLLCSRNQMIHHQIILQICHYEHITH